jgi:hypothetical protein
MLPIKINLSEKYRLISFYDDMQNEGHWGNSAIEIPEEKELFNLINKSEGEITLTINQVELLGDWIFNATGEGVLLLPDDITLIKKIHKVLNEHYSELYNKYSAELSLLENIIFKLRKISPESNKSSVPVKIPGKKDLLDINPGSPDIKSPEKDNNSCENLNDISKKIISESKITGFFKKIISEDDIVVMPGRNNVQTKKIKDNNISENSSNLKKPATVNEKTAVFPKINFMEDSITKIKDFFEYIFEKNDKPEIQNTKTTSARDRLENAKQLAKKIKKIQ